MVIPLTAVAWRRGQDFEYGKPQETEARPTARGEARVLVLEDSRTQPNRTASTQFLKKEVPKYIELSPQDRAPSKSRPREQVWQQIVGNVISHKDVRDGPFSKGYASKTLNGL